MFTIQAIFHNVSYLGMSNSSVKKDIINFFKTITKHCFYKVKISNPNLKTTSHHTGTGNFILFLDAI